MKKEKQSMQEILSNFWEEDASLQEEKENESLNEHMIQIKSSYHSLLEIEKTLIRAYENLQANEKNSQS